MALKERGVQTDGQRTGKGEDMGINRFSDIEERKWNETDAKAGDEVRKEKKGIPLPACRPPRSQPRTKRSARSLRSSRSRDANHSADPTSVGRDAV